MINFKPFHLEAHLIGVLKPQNRGLVLKPGESVKAEVVDILPSGAVVLKIKGQLAEVHSEIPLQKGNQLLLKILQTKNKNQIKIKLIPQNLQTEKTKPKLKTPSLSFINQHSFQILKEKLFNLWDFSPSQLKQIVLNSGNFFEKKLLKKEQVQEDLKFKLSKLLESSVASSEEKEMAKQLLNLITSNQILSKDIQGLVVFLPLLIPHLKLSNLIYKKINQNKKVADFILLDLEFEDAGKIVVSIFYAEKHLAVTFFCENEKFLDKLKESINLLKKELSNRYSTAVSFSKKVPQINDIIKKLKKEQMVDLKA